MRFGVCHQSACATHQSAASCSAAVAGIRVSGYRAGHRRSRSGVPGRSIGGAEPVGPVFHPNNGDVSHKEHSRVFRSGLPSPRAWGTVLDGAWCQLADWTLSALRAVPRIGRFAFHRHKASNCAGIASSQFC